VGVGVESEVAGCSIEVDRRRDCRCFVLGRGDLWRVRASSADDVLPACKEDYVSGWAWQTLFLHVMVGCLRDQSFGIFSIEHELELWNGGV
jgi:hypothetical protein